MTNALISDSPALQPFVPEWSKPAAPTAADYQSYSAEQARRYGIDPEIERRKIQQESGFRPTDENGKPLTSSAGAIGIAQFMPGTAADEGIDPTDPYAALEASARHSANLLKTFGGDQRAATAAYNAGAGNIGALTKKYGADWESHLEEQLGPKGAAETRLYLSSIHGDGYHGVPQGTDVQMQPDSGSVGGASTGAMFSRPDNGISITPWDLPADQQITPPGVDPSVHGFTDGNTGDVPYAAGTPTLNTGSPDLYANTGDVPYAAGQDNPAVLGANNQSRAVQAVNDFANGPSLFSKVKDVATNDLPYADEARGAVQSAYDASIPGTRGIVKPANVLAPLGTLSAGINAAKAGAGYLGANLPSGGQVIGSQVPTTPLDVLTSLPPGTITKGLGIAGKLKGAGGVLSIIGDAESNAKKAQQARKMYDTLKAAGHSDEEIAAALGQTALDLARGGAASQRATGAATKLTVDAQGQAAKNAYETTLKDTGSVEMATAEARRAAGLEAGANDTLRAKAGALTERMQTPPGAAGIVDAASSEPQWAPASLTAARDLGKVGETGRFAPEEIAKMTDEALGQALDQTRGQIPFIDLHAEGFKRAGNTAEVATVEKVRGQYANDLVNLEAEAAKRGTGTLAAEADRLSSGAVGTPISERDQLLGKVAQVARDVGDPFSTLRGMLKPNGNEPGAQQQAVPGDIRGAAAEEKQARRDEVAALRAAGKAKEAADVESRAAEIDRLREANKATVEANRAAIDEGLQHAATPAPQDIADVAKPGANAFTEAAAAEREAARAEPAAQRATQQAERQTAEEARMAERDAWIEKNKAAVEANRQGLDTTLPAVSDEAVRTTQYAERLKAARETAKASGQPGRIGAEIAGAAGAPRALALAADLGTARDLTLLGSSRQGLKPALEGAGAGAKAFVSEEAAQASQEAVKANPWHDFVTSKKNFDRPFHVYEYGEGVPADLRVPEMSGLNTSKISETIGNLPWVKASDRALAIQRNVAGMNLLERRAEELAMKYGVDTPQFYKEMQSTIDSVNHLRGYSGGDMAKKLGAINFLTSPQQMISRLQLIGDPISFALRGDKESAKFAAENLLGFATSQTALLALAKATGNGRWSVNANPTSSDFGQIKIGNTRYDTLAGMGPLIRLVSRIGAAGSDAAFGTDYAKNQAEVGTLIQRWLENKENPSSKIVTDFMLHNKVPDEKTAIGLIAPTLATGVMDSLATERGSLTQRGAAATGAAIANAGGIGTTTYKSADDVKRETAQDLGINDYAAASDLDKLKVLANLPSDAPKNVAQDERQKYTADLKSAGYVEAPKDEDGKPVIEADDTKRKRLAANTEVIKKNPELDVQSWYYNGAESGDGVRGSGTVHSLEAADKAIALGIKDRPVYYGGADRNFAASEDDHRALKDRGGLLDQYLNPSEDLIKAFSAQEKYKGKPQAEIRKGAIGDVKDAMRQIPAVDAALVFFGIGGNSDSKKYLLHTPDSLAELQKLWDAYPKAQKFAQPGWGADFAQGALRRAA